MGPGVRASRWPARCTAVPSTAHPTSAMPTAAPTIDPTTHRPAPDHREGGGERTLRPASDPASLRALALVGGGVIAAGVGGALWSPVRPAIGRWYRGLDKPPYTPPDPVFGVAWSVLYPLIAASAWRVHRAPPSPERSRAVRLWWAQLVLNAAWTPLFFGRRSVVGGFVDAAALAAAATAYTAAARRVDRPAAALAAPYVAWTIFAAVLAGSILRRNRVRSG